MKRICVFSDSHGCPDNMIRVMEQENPDMVIHLGDGEGDLVPLKNRYPRTEVLNVRGNCDGRSAAPMKLVLRVEQVRLFAVHGHEYNVKFDRTLTKLRYSAMEAEANVVLFGHTHKPYQDHSLAMEILNPGSIGYGARPSYGLLTVNGSKVTVELKRIDPA